MSGIGSNIPPGTPPDPARGGARRASVTLRAQQEGGDASELMDPANQSLADALRITFRVVQLLMVALACLYVFSGFQTINETQQGIRVLFGKKQAEGLEPGFRFSYPAPLGELLKVNTGNVTLDLYSDFWPSAGVEQKDSKIDDLPKSPMLNPERDGSLLTADNNLVHVKLQVIYRRDHIGEYAQNVLPDDQIMPTETNLVRGAVKRAVVRAVAETNIDDLLREASGEAGSVASKAKEMAQAILDRSKTGIHIEQLKIDDKMPPLYLREGFAKVQTAAASAATEKEKAKQDRDANLNGVAGAAAPVLIGLIDAYELSIAKKDAETGRKLMEAIDAVLDGRETEINGTPVRQGLVSGEVTSILAEARQYRTEVINLRRSELAMFKAKLEQFRTSPLVMVQREWADAMVSFMDRDSVQVLLAPLGTHTLQLTINADPSILKAIEKGIKLKENEESAKKRAEEQQKAQYKIDTGLKVRAE